MATLTARDVAREHYLRQQANARRTADAVQAWWGELDPADLDASWSRVGPGVALITSAGQALAAGQADDYTAAVLAAQGVDPAAAGQVDPLAFSGTASDGRPLASLLYEPVIAAKVAIAGGAGVDDAMLAGLASMLRIVGTQVQDAGRTADGVAITARRHVGGYVRMLDPPSCGRCAILAGAWYRWNTGFDRHPHCDCVHVPANEGAAGDLRTDPRRYFDSLHPADQDRLFTQDGARAIRDGADINRVVNARRGMTAAGDRLLTREAAGRRLRLMPEQIYADAADRDDAIRLLHRFGYLT
ncbi:MAG: hypothetical protein ACJ74O_13550 [Frankiaceae bacterium]|jgi:hypothetical protein